MLSPDDKGKILEANRKVVATVLALSLFEGEHSNRETARFDFTSLSHINALKYIHLQHAYIKAADELDSITKDVFAVEFADMEPYFEAQVKSALEAQAAILQHKLKSAKDKTLKFKTGKIILVDNEDKDE